MKDQVHKLQEINEKKDSHIIELRENHRLKLDNIKRTEKHCENLKSRLEICFKELIMRDEEIKREKKLNPSLNRSTA